MYEKHTDMYTINITIHEHSPDPYITAADSNTHKRLLTRIVATHTDTEKSAQNNHTTVVVDRIPGMDRTETVTISNMISKLYETGHKHHI